MSVFVPTFSGSESGKEISGTTCSHKRTSLFTYLVCSGSRLCL